jgi:hypothetical protein
MSAGKHLIARFLHQFNTDLRSAQLLKCRLHRGRWLGKLGLAESANLSLFEFLVLGTCLTCVVGLALALWVATEILGALVASDAILSHAFGGFLCDWLTFIIFLV